MNQIQKIENDLDLAAIAYIYMPWWSRLFKTDNYFYLRTKLILHCRRMSQCLQHMDIEPVQYNLLSTKLAQYEANL